MTFETEDLEDEGEASLDEAADLTLFNAGGLGAALFFKPLGSSLMSFGVFYRSVNEVTSEVIKVVFEDNMVFT